MRVLIIEDELKIARALRKALIQEGYAVDVSYDGDDGYAMATTEPYDVAIIDLMIPGEYKGLDIVRAMRQFKINTPVLILTAMTSIEDRASGLDNGADDYLIKPFALDELLARIRALLRRPSEQQSSILTAGNLTFDTNRMIVKRGDRKIELTRKESSLLEYLMRNQGRPVSKEMIISHVWNYEADVLPNTVEVHVSFLRTRIDDGFSNKLIHTVRGVGYKLEAKQNV